MGRMHLRRAVLLFAIVLGLAAVAASLSRERDGEDGRSARSEAPVGRAPKRAPTASPGRAGAVERPLRFDASRASRTLALEQGRAGVVEVRVPAPGQVDIEGLGLTASAEPLTPARFDVLAREPGRHPVRFTPAGGEDGGGAGVLVIRPRGRS
jgi:hypothetical protein